MKSYKFLFFSIYIVLISSCLSNNNESNSEERTPKYIQSQFESRHSAPFSEATEYNGLLFLTGQVGKDHRVGEVVESGIEAETKQVLNNIKDILEANGSDLEHVLKCTVILSNIDDFNEMNKVYRTFFTKNKPARTTFAADLVSGYKVEIEVIAVKK